MKATLEAVQLELQNEKLRYKEAVDQINDLSRLLKLREAEAEKARENVIEKKPFSVAQFESRVKNIQRRKSGPFYWNIRLLSTIFSVYCFVERALKRTASQADFDRRVDMYDRLHEVRLHLLSSLLMTGHFRHFLGCRCAHVRKDSNAAHHERSS